MICAYDKVYLNCAKRVLGRMLDFAVHDLKYSIQEFFSLFIKSGVAERFGKGDYTILAGKSGVEVVHLQFSQNADRLLSHLFLPFLYRI